MGTPERTCIGCRRKGQPSEFARILRTGAGRLELDPTRRGGGRGAYVCLEESCVERAVQQKTLRHVFRLSDPIPNDQLAGLTHALRHRIEGAHENS